MRILFLFEDSKLSNRLCKAISQIGYQADTGSLSEYKSFWTRSTDYDLIILEHNSIPSLTTVCKYYREVGRSMPILLIVEALTSQEAVELFNYGVDDYTSKFTSLPEIIARCKALLRRPKHLATEKIIFEDLILDCQNFSVSRGDKQILLTKKEFGILEYLLRHAGTVLTRTSLIEHVWDINADLFSNTLETHILNLRKKVEVPGKSKLIHTISGRGYKLERTDILNH